MKVKYVYVSIVEDEVPDPKEGENPYDLVNPPDIPGHVLSDTLLEESFEEWTLNKLAYVLSEAIW